MAEEESFSAVTVKTFEEGSFCPRRHFTVTYESVCLFDSLFHIIKCTVAFLATLNIGPIDEMNKIY